MLDRVTSMQVFARVASLGGFSAAARVLGMSQTMATKHVVALEDRLGVKLFHRTTRRLSLTDAGKRYLDACERILAEIVEAETVAAADRIEPRGTLRLNVPLSFGLREIAPLVPEFCALHPALTVDLGLNDRVVDLVDEGWDLAVRIARMSDSTLVMRRLAPCRLILCASPDYLEHAGTPYSVADLSRYNCLGYTLPNAAAAERWRFGRAGEVNVPVSGNLKASNGDALRLAALAGQGLIYQPSFIVGDDVRAGRLIALPLDEAPHGLLAINAVFPSDRNPPAKVRAFVDFLIERWTPMPPWDRDLDTGEALAGALSPRHVSWPSVPLP